MIPDEPKSMDFSGTVFLTCVQSLTMETSGPPQESHVYDIQVEDIVIGGEKTG